MKLKLFLTICFLINSAKPLKDKNSSKKSNNDDTYSNAHDFKCVIIPPSENVTSVHKLKISDIKAVGALGDSLSTGFAVDADGFFSVIKDYRGVSFSAGVDESLETLVTLPNIMKKFNQNLVGYSTGNNLFYRKTDNHFNVATSREQASSLALQAKELIKRMKNSKDFVYQKDWKLITIFIGTLDLCDSCFDKQLFSAQSYINFIKKGLSILYNELPKTFVNIIAPVRLHKVNNVSFNNFCKQYQKHVCTCGLYPKNETAEKEFISLHEQYVNSTRDLVNSNRYEREDFTVVVQPFLQNFELPRTKPGELDIGYFAIDCLHFSRKGQKQLAISLWNSMFTSIKKKKTNWDLNSQLKCPSVEKPYLCTRKNNC